MEELWNWLIINHINGFPYWLRWERICLQCRRPGFGSWVCKLPCRREWLPTPVFLPGKFHKQRSLVGYSPREVTKSRHDWATNTFTFTNHIKDTSGQNVNKKKQLKQVNQGICNSQNRRAALSKRENSRVLSLKKRMSALFPCFPGGTAVKNPPANAGNARDMCLIPATEPSPGVGNSNLLQYSCLENPMDRGPWRATVHRSAKELDTTKHSCMHTFLSYM